MSAGTETTPMPIHLMSGSEIARHHWDEISRLGLERNIAELEEALSVRPDFILLDNMTTAQMRAAVERVGGAIPLEASGGITLENVRQIAETGVDRISIGSLTKDVRATDYSLRVKL